MFETKLQSDRFRSYLSENVEKIEKSEKTEKYDKSDYL